MRYSFKHLNGKGNYLAGLILLLFTGVICVAFINTDKSDFDIARREILLRRVGHELLLQSGDVRSRVLPVENISENEYQIRFENELTFQPDSLVKTTQRLLSKDPLSNEYIVNVLNCGSNNVAYGYAISQNKKDDIIACQSREQPKACYIINIKFKPAQTAITKTMFLLGGLPVLAFVGLFFIRSAKPQRTAAADQSTNTYALGQVLFNAQERNLAINNEATALTATETRLLLIFASAPNQTIARSRLQKEIWEDEGVIVGRSLDMFISKLRKKLELDPNIKIAVIRGKGYRLEIGA